MVGDNGIGDFVLGGIEVGILRVNLNAQHDGDWVALPQYRSLIVVFLKSSGTVGTVDPDVVLHQAKNNAGYDFAGLDFKILYMKSGSNLRSIPAWTKVELAAADQLYDFSGGGNQEVIALIRIDGEDLRPGFTHVRVRTHTTGPADEVPENQQYCSVLYLLGNPRHLVGLEDMADPKA